MFNNKDGIKKKKLVFFTSANFTSIIINFPGLSNTWKIAGFFREILVLRSVETLEVKNLFTLLISTVVDNNFQTMQLQIFYII